ncbi:MAG: M2 family metallopeptidase [Thermoplasmata archaeon]|nr:M2 family metallopeptidase [Thermoplasmata archaeon]
MSSPSPRAAEPWMHDAEARLLDLSIESSRAEWIQATYITDDTQAIASRTYARLIGETVALAKEATRMAPGFSTPVLARKAMLLRNSLPLIAPSDAAEARELTETVTAMQATYSKGMFQPTGAKEPLDLQALSHRLGESRSPAELEEIWNGWHRIARPMRPQFARYVELANRGAREVGFADTGAMWRSKYDMSPSEFSADVERIWEQVKPLYTALHAYVRAKLRAQYGSEAVPPDGPIPAHLLGNMWAQSWESVSPIVAPTGGAPAFDLTDILRRRGTAAPDMVRFAERFFVSLGFQELPPSFWERSLLVRPRDREVVCHASAWDIDFEDDLRIKMCIDITGEDFQTIHHELGHNYYQRAYRAQPFLFRDSANDGFHEAVGDTIGLSVTPEYLVRVGLLEQAPDPSKDLALLLRTALEKVAFLPFGYLIDRWRWEVFSGAVGPERYNESWWDLKRKYQGVAPPSVRSEADFDPGAKFHVAANVPYMRYFLAHVLQFQFHRALARIVDWNGPLHRCSIYGNKDAGARLIEMLAMGASRPWPDALYALTGERRVDASAMMEYFQPLVAFLEKETRDVSVGW